MKVIQAYLSFGPGGREKYLISLTKNLERMGIENIIVCQKGGYIHHTAKFSNLKTYGLDARPLFNFKWIFDLIKIVKEEKVNILHIHDGKMYWPSIFARWFCRRFYGIGLKLVFTRNLDTRSSVLTRRHYHFADKIIAVSKKVAKNLVIYNKAPEEKIVTIYNGVDVEEFTSFDSKIDIRKKYNLEGKIVIGCIGAINRPKGKGQQYLIEVASLLREKFSQLRYMIVGEGSLRKDLEEFAKMVGVEDIVIFTGYQENVKYFIKAMDIVCLLSVGTEALGNVLIEAQVLGKPVIGTKVGGIPETFIDGRTGILIPKDDVKALKTALEVLIVDERKRLWMGKEAREWAISNFDIKKSCEKTKLVYESVWRI